MTTGKSQQKNRKLTYMVLIVAIAAIVLGVFTSKTHQKKNSVFNSKEMTATVLTQVRKMPTFNLIDDNGKPFNNASLEGKWTFLFFGFTNCPHICPTTMAELNKMYQDLEKAGNKPLPTVALVTIDPKRDTVKRMHDYVRSFNKNFIGVRGNATQIKKLTSNLGVMYMKVMQDKNGSAKKDDYDIDHSGTVFLINPQGHLAALFSMPHRADNIAKDFVKIEKYHRKMA